MTTSSAWLRHGNSARTSESYDYIHINISIGIYVTWHCSAIHRSGRLELNPCWTVRNNTWGHSELDAPQALVDLPHVRVDRIGGE